MHRRHRGLEVLVVVVLDGLVVAMEVTEQMDLGAVEAAEQLEADEVAQVVS